MMVVRAWSLPIVAMLVLGMAGLSSAGAVEIVLVGDSTVNDEGGWGPGLAACLDRDVVLTNLAKNGRSTKSFIEEGLWEQALAAGGDYYLIQFGHNDEPGKPGRSTEIDEYRRNLLRYVDDVRAAKAVPVLVTSLVRRTFTAAGRIESSLDTRAEIVREIARGKKVPLIELHDRSLALCESLGPEGCDSLNPRKADGTVDRTHLTPAAATAFGRLVADELRRAVPELETKITVDVPRDGSPLDPGLGHDAVLLREFILPRSWPSLSCHASTICEDGPGRLVAAWFGGTAERNPDVEIWVAHNDGRGWSEPVRVIDGVQADGSRQPCWNPVLFRPAAEGPLFLYAKVGPNPRDWWGVVRESTDGGLTWGPLRRLPEGVIGPIKNKPLVRPDGTVIAGVSTEHDGWRVHFERSTDGGRSFTAGPPVNVAPGTKSVPRPEGVAEHDLIDAIQPSLLTLGGDRLLAVGRTRQGRIFEVESDDGGVSWGRMRLGNLPIPSSGTDAVTLADGRHLIVYNHTKGAARTPLTVAMSADGRTWRPVVALETLAGSFAYPAVIQAADGLVHVTYTWNRETIAHAVIDPGKLPSAEELQATRTQVRHARPAAPSLGASPADESARGPSPRGVLRVELNGDNGRRDVLTRGWTDWRVPDGEAATTTIGDLTFRLRAIGDAASLTAGWWTRGFDFGATLASDGIQVAGPGAAIELVIEGLPPGPHSLTTGHAAWAATLPAAFTVTIDGKPVVAGRDFP